MGGVGGSGGGGRQTLFDPFRGQELGVFIDRHFAKPRHFPALFLLAQRLNLYRAASGALLSSACQVQEHTEHTHKRATPSGP